MSKKPGFKLWDSIALSDNIKLAIQIKDKLEKLSVESKIPIEELPDSLVPTDVLYDIVACFTATYDMLLDRDLVMTGNLKSPNKHNNIH